MAEQDIDLVRGEDNVILFDTSGASLDSNANLLLLTNRNIVVKQNADIDNQIVTCEVTFTEQEIENIFATEGADSTFRLINLNEDAVIVFGAIEVTGEGGGSGSDVIFTDGKFLKTTAAIADVPIGTACEIVQAGDKKHYEKNAAGTAWQEVGSDGVKEYVAHLYHDGVVTDPVVTVIKNTLGNVVWTKTAMGVYSGTLLNAFPKERTIVSPITYLSSGNFLKEMQKESVSVVNVLTYAIDDPDLLAPYPMDGLLDDVVSITVFP